MLEISFHSDAERRGTLFMDRERVQTLTSLVPTAISLTHLSVPNRDRVERFIESVYARGYGSCITQHYPTLMDVHDASGHVAAAVGMRRAGEDHLFLERYLEAPIEDIATQAYGEPITRDEIVEIGNLASAGNGASVFLFVTLAAYLRQQNLSYAAVTATQALRRSFALFGIPFLEIGRADAAALPDRGAAWGTYYSKDPKVLIGAITPAYARLEPYLPLTHNKELKQLFARLHPEALRTLQ